MVKNPPAMQETQIWSLDHKDPLEKGMATHSSILPGGFHDRGAWRATVHGLQNRPQLSDFTFYTFTFTKSLTWRYDLINLINYILLQVYIEMNACLGLQMP